MRKGRRGRKGDGRLDPKQKAERERDRRKEVGKEKGREGEKRRWESGTEAERKEKRQDRRKKTNKQKKEKEEKRPCTNLETSGMCSNLGQRPPSVAKIRQ